MDQAAPRLGGERIGWDPETRKLHVGLVYGKKTGRNGQATGEDPLPSFVGRGLDRSSSRTNENYRDDLREAEADPASIFYR